MSTYNTTVVYQGSKEQTLWDRNWSNPAPEPTSPGVQIPAAVCKIGFNDINSSNPQAFLDFLHKNPDVFEANNIIFSHGGFIRKLAKTLHAPQDTISLLQSLEKNNLFVLEFKAFDKSFYMVRHCLKQLQKIRYGGALTTRTLTWG
jgi:broad specificity phosphatase PhoE